jgi:hypothetical protein
MLEKKKTGIFLTHQGVFSAFAFWFVLGQVIVVVIVTPGLMGAARDFDFEPNGL